MIIGLTGPAQSGKDSFFELAKEYFNSFDIRIKRVALADNLKKDLSSFMQDKFNIDIIKKAIFITAIKNKKAGKKKIKLLINSLSFTLIIKDIEKKINIKKLEQKKEIDIRFNNSNMREIIDLQRIKKF